MVRESMMKTKRPRPLKADLHLHTAEDPLDRVRHTAKELISKAADEGFDVISITNHHQMTFNHDLLSYAQDRGILLIPGVEMTIQRRHVLVLNPPPHRMCSDFLSLSKLRRPETLIIAPHPYFPGTYSLNGYLLKHSESLRRPRILPFLFPNDQLQPKSCRSLPVFWISISRKLRCSFPLSDGNHLFVNLCGEES